MGYLTTRGCLRDLEQRGELVRIDQEVDADLEVAAIQRRVFAAGGPALLFTRVRGCDFPMAGNIYGTMERTRFIFRDALERVETLLSLKADPMSALKRPLKALSTLPGLWHTRPKKLSSGPILSHETTLSRLPMLRSWPLDGGGYVTLPQVYTESPLKPGFAGSNLGMYRVQLSGGALESDREAGLHYQIHRGIGHHHAQALEAGRPLKVNVFVGGPPAMTLAAIMPLPEGIAEILFAGVLGGGRVEMIPQKNGLPLLAEADFCICGEIVPGVEKPEGPFGDHLGYYSLIHDFPVLRVERVLHRPDPVWPFTTVGRPPQEDTVFGDFIHELTAELVPTVFSGVREVHAVDAAGVHPLLLAVGSERYVPYARERRPQELITCGMALLGSTQTSLSKYVLIVAGEDDRTLSARDIPRFFRHVLERADWTRDLHFITRTTIDTLDYSGISLNQGSKLLLAVAGEPRNRLAADLPPKFTPPSGYGAPRVHAPGVLVLQGPKHVLGRDEQDPAMEAFCRALESASGLDGFPLVVVADDAEFTTASWDNFLWTVFTRSDPATDMYGVSSFTHAKHWGCQGALVIDARLKGFHAPPLATDPDVEKRVDRLGAPGGPLHGII